MDAQIISYLVITLLLVVILILFIKSITELKKARHAPAKTLFKTVVKGSTSEIEGVKISKDMAPTVKADGSVYGRKYEKFMHNKLFYISWALTIVATIFFIILLVVQYGSRIGQSTQDGFVLYSFFLIYLAPSISWLIYYLATSKWLTDFIKAKEFKVHEKNQAAKKRVKKSEAIKEIKEARELLDLGVITQAEYDELAEKLKPIILNS